MDDINKGKAFLTRIKEIVQVEEDTFSMFRYQINDLKGNLLNDFFKELREDLTKGYEAVFEKYMPNLWEDMFNRSDPRNVDREFHGYYPDHYFEDFYTKENGFDEWGATCYWLDIKIDELEQLLDYLNKKLGLKLKVTNAKEVKGYRVINKLVRSRLIDLRNILVEKNYIDNRAFRNCHSPCREYGNGDFFTKTY